LSGARSALRPKTGGRKAGVPNKATREIKEIAQQFGPAAIRQLAKLGGLLPGGKGAAESEQARTMACNSILDRGYGKPGQAVMHSGSVGSYDVTKLAALSDEELKLFESVLAKIAPGAAAAVGGEGGDSEAS
jgi:hypothetical protein